MVTEEEWSGEAAKSARFRLLSAVIGMGIGALTFVPCMMLGSALASGIYADVISVGIIMALTLPTAGVLIVMGEHRQQRSDEKVRSLNAELSTQAHRQRFETRLANALEMAEGESEAIRVIERSFASVLPEAPIELLLADNSHAHLHRMAAVGRKESCQAVRWTRLIVVRRRAEPRSKSLPIATTSIPAPNCRIGHRASSQRCAFRCRSWGARWASSTPLANRA
jgi:hypothetical protein